MNHYRILLIPLAIFLIFSTMFVSSVSAISVVPVSPGGQKVTGNQWLFVIGIDSYIEWRQLKTAVSDAKAVKNVLLSRYHFDAQHLIELYDEQATRQNIIEKLRLLAQTLKPHDSLFIFYAGHGHLDKITKTGSWIPVESGVHDASAWISNHYIKNYLRSDAIRAKHILLVSDSCFSGDFFRGTRGKLPDVTSETIRRSYQLTSRQAITSGGLEPVSDSGFGNNSVFTHFFVNALKKNDNPFLIPSVFFNEIQAGVSQNAEQLPVFGPLHNTGGQSGGEFVFFLKQEARLQNLSDIEKSKRDEYNRLLEIQENFDKAKQKEVELIAKKEKDLFDLDQKIKAMKNRLGTSNVKIDDSLDAMLTMVKHKEDQAKKLDELKQQRLLEQQIREREIARLKKEKNDKIISDLKIEVEKYKQIISSEYGKELKESAWKALIAKCPAGWATGIELGDYHSLLHSPETRAEFTKNNNEFDSPLLKKSSEKKIKNLQPEVSYTNLALGKAIRQSSTWGPGVAERAVDGNTNGNWSSRSVSHTKCKNNSWIEVDLGATCSIDEIIIYNRTDGGWGRRLDNFYVIVSESPITGIDQEGIHRFYKGTAQKINRFKVGKKGRWCRVQLKNKNCLHIAELEVWGHPSAKRTPEKTINNQRTLVQKDVTKYNLKTDEIILVQNAPNYSVQILSGPFTTKNHLMPDETIRVKGNIAPGLFHLYYEWKDLRTNEKGRKTVKKRIKPGQKIFCVSDTLARQR